MPPTHIQKRPLTLKRAVKRIVRICNTEWMTYTEQKLADEVEKVLVELLAAEKLKEMEMKLV